MAIQLPTSGLAVRFAGRLVVPSDKDAERITRTLGLLVERLEALIELTSDVRVGEVPTKMGSGQTRSPVHIDVERVVQTAQETLTALSGRELDLEHLERILEDLLMKVNIVRQIFEHLPEEYVRRPVELGTGYVVTAEVVAGMLSADAAFYVLLDELEALDQ